MADDKDQKKLRREKVREEASDKAKMSRAARVRARDEKAFESTDKFRDVFGIAKARLLRRAELNVLGPFGVLGEMAYSSRRADKGQKFKAIKTAFKQNLISKFTGKLGPVGDVFSNKLARSLQFQDGDSRDYVKEQNDINKATGETFNLIDANFGKVQEGFSEVEKTVDKMVDEIVAFKKETEKENETHAKRIDDLESNFQDAIRDIRQDIQDHEERLSSLEEMVDQDRPPRRRRRYRRNRNNRLAGRQGMQQSRPSLASRNSPMSLVRGNPLAMSRPGMGLGGGIGAADLLGGYLGARVAGSVLRGAGGLLAGGARVLGGWGAYALRGAGNLALRNPYALGGALLLGGTAAHIKKSWDQGGKAVPDLAPDDPLLDSDSGYKWGGRAAQKAQRARRSTPETSHADGVKQSSDFWSQSHQQSGGSFSKSLQKNNAAKRALPSYETMMDRYRIEQEKKRFMQFGQLPSGFEMSPGYMGRLGTPYAVASAGAQPLGYGGGSGGGYSFPRGTYYGGSRGAGSPTYGATVPSSTADKTIDDQAKYWKGGSTKTGLNEVPIVPSDRIDRTKFLEELKDPNVMRAFAGRMHTEVGSQGEQAMQAWAETTFNRAAARNKSLLQTVTGAYFPTHNPGSSDKQAYHDIIRRVAKDGTNITKGATGNASGTVGFGWGSTNGGQTAAFGGERFGIEKADAKWKPTFLPGGRQLPPLALMNPDYLPSGSKYRENSEIPAQPFTGGGDASEWAKKYTRTQMALGLTPQQYDAYRTAVGAIESGNNPNMGAGGAGNDYWGPYQFGAAATIETNKLLGENVLRQQFKGNPDLAERHFDALSYLSHQHLMKNSPQYQAMSPTERLGVLGYAHNQGAGAATKWLRTGQEGRDAFGTSGKAYYNAIQKSIGNLSNKTVYVGDSVANGLAGSGDKAHTKVGRGAQATLDHILSQPPEAWKDKNVVLSSGALNDSNFDAVQKQIEYLKQNGANVTLIGGPGQGGRSDLSQHNSRLEQIAKNTGVQFKGGYASADGVHPQSYSSLNSQSSANQTTTARPTNFMPWTSLEKPPTNAEIDTAMSKGTRNFDFDKSQNGGSDAAQYIKSKGGNVIAYHRGPGNPAWGESAQSKGDVINQIKRMDEKYIHLDNQERWNYSDFKEVMDSARSAGKVIQPKGAIAHWNRYFSENPEYKSQVLYASTENQANNGDIKGLKQLNQNVPTVNMEWQKGSSATSEQAALNLHAATGVPTMRMAGTETPSGGQGGYDSRGSQVVGGDGYQAGAKQNLQSRAVTFPMKAQQGPATTAPAVPKNTPVNLPSLFPEGFVKSSGAGPASSYADSQQYLRNNVGASLGGVNPKLKHSMGEGIRLFEQEFGSRYRVEMLGPAGGTRSAGGYHSQGQALDMVIIDKQTGKKLTNFPGYESRGFQGTVGENAPIYQELMNRVRIATEKLYPEMGDSVRWGAFGEWSGNRMDIMHYDFGGKKSPGTQGYGSFEKGFSPELMRRWNIPSNNPIGNIRDAVNRTYSPPVEQPPGGTDPERALMAAVNNMESQQFDRRVENQVMRNTPQINRMMQQGTPNAGGVAQPSPSPNQPQPPDGMDAQTYKPADVPAPSPEAQIAQNTAQVASDTALPPPPEEPPPPNGPGNREGPGPGTNAPSTNTDGDVPEGGGRNNPETQDAQPGSGGYGAQGRCFVAFAILIISLKILASISSMANYTGLPLS